MNGYTIYCTPSQTRRALELGAPIEINSLPPGNDENFMWLSPPKDVVAWNNSTNCLIPTAEQMIGWLEEQGIRFSISSILIGHYEQGKIITDNITYEILVNKDDTNIKHGEDYSSRKEATIAAIDAALDYLSNNK